LEQNGYAVKTSSNINEALKNINIIQPHFILLDWNLKSTNVTKVYDYFTEKLGISCLVYSEETNSRSTSQLMKSQIRNTLFPPVGGLGIHRRIQIFLQGNAKRKHRRRVKASRNFGTIKVSGDEVESDTIWAPAEVSISEVKADTSWANNSPSDNGSIIAWKGTAVADGNTELVYFFKGPKKPEFNKALGKWDGLDEKCPIIMQERQISKEMSSSQDGFKQDQNIFSMIQKNLATGEYSYTPEQEEEEALPTPVPINQDEINKALGIFKKDEEVNIGGSNPISLIATCVKEVLDQLTDEVLSSTEIKSNFVALEISSPRFKGYLLIGGENTYPKEESAQNFYTKLQSRLEQSGEVMEKSNSPIPVKMEWKPFKDWTKGGAEFVIADAKQNKEFLFAFMSLSSLPIMKLREEVNFVEVKFESWLMGNTVLGFNIYLHMPLRQKYILYLKKNSIIEGATLSKFLALDVKSFFISADERNQFLAYCIERKVLDRSAA
jgi:hypothetical protein